MYGINVLCSTKRVARLCSVRLYSSKSTKKLLEFLAEMPKANTARISEAQRQRKNISKKSDKYAPSTVYLQVIGSGARGAPSTLYLFTDQKRYLFNCGECTQRLAHEHKVKLSKLDHIFITSKTWRNIGGLPGLSLTLQDVGVPNITLHGPEGLDELYHATKRFVVMKDMNITMANCTPSEDFEDNALNIRYVLLGRQDNILTPELKPATKKPKLESPDKEYEEFIHDQTDYYKPELKPADLKHKTVLNERPKPKPNDKDAFKKKTEKALHDLQKMSNCTVAYICTLKKRLGTLDLAKCVQLGVKPGPMLGQLKSGEDVVLPDGTLVLSKDVKTPDDPGPVFIVLEVPDLTYLKESEFSAHFDNGENPPENIPTIIVHYTPPHIFNHPTYRAFMQMFGSSTRHLVLNTQNSCLGSEAVHRTQHKLHLLDSDIFPQLRDVGVQAVWNSHPTPTNDSPTRRGLEELKNKVALAQFQNIINMEGSKGDGQLAKEEDGGKLELITARTLTQFHLRPKRQVDRSAEPKLHVQEYIQETMDVDGFVGSLEQFRRLVDNMRYAKLDSQKEFPKIIFLGTGSCIPSKTRNTSAIVLQVDENRSILMDCGEGTFGQLVRFYGPKKVNNFLRTLKAVYVSHLHADHHIGLVGILQARREAFEQKGDPLEPLYLLAPGQIFTWLSVYDQQFERIKPDFTLVPNQNLLENATLPQPASADLTSAILANIGVQSICTCLVSHCPNAFGVAIDVDGTNKITYSGDTIPCEALAAIGKDSTLLIHEATMEDELADEARIKMHSTTTQAIEMGKLMNAKYTVLTHFSQRYARLPRLNANILNDNKTVGIAFDNMQITMSDLELLPHMYAPLQLMFAEHCVEMEMKAAHRARHRERQERRHSPSMPMNTAIKDKGSKQVSDKSRKPTSSLIPRRVSPGCRAICSSPASYRESNASRLRQEMKGMTITGVVVKVQQRSKSSSSYKRATNSSPTRSVTSEGPPLKHQDSEQTIELLATPRTMSETSNCSRDSRGNPLDKIFRITSALPCGHLVDTRSKTLSTYQPASEKDKPTSRPGSRDRTPPNFTVRCNTNAYGKPLVTPMNKKLAIRRDFLAQDSMPNNAKAPIVCRTKSPSQSSKVEPKGPTSNSHVYCDITKKILIPTKESASTNSLRSTNLVVKREDKREPLGGPNKGIVKPFSAAQKSSSPSSPSQNRFGKSTSRLVKSAEIKRTQDTKLPARSIARPVKSNDYNSNSLHKPDLIVSSTTRPSITKIPRKISPDNSVKPATMSYSSTENLKQQFCRDTPVYSTGRPGSLIHNSTKSFKPQLEDIKSSYLLLNKEEKDKTKPVENETPLSRFDDEKRRQQLIEAKRKFLSRGFFNDSRFEKIEGLNWITWKF